MSCQILYLFDLDQCIPLEEPLESESLEFCISQVKDVCSRILSSASHLDGPNLEHKNTAHFSFKFYSSTGYFLVPARKDDNTDKFEDFHADTFDIMETALSDRFETLLQSPSKTNSFKAEDLKNHIKASSLNKCHAVNLQRALEEIAVLFNWDRPLIHSPVKSKQTSNYSRNAVYIFTKLPRSKEELGVFLGKPAAKRSFSYSDIQSRAFASKAILNILKESNVSINVIDTDSLRVQNAQLTTEDFKVKSLFKKCLSNFKGNVIPLSAFCTDNCHNTENPYSASMLLTNSYFDHDKPLIKTHEVKLYWENTTLSILCSDNIGSQIIVEKMIKNLPMSVTSSIFDKIHLLLPGPERSSIRTLCHFLIANRCSAFVRCAQQFAVLKAIDESHLSLQTGKVSHQHVLVKLAIR